MTTHQLAVVTIRYHSPTQPKVRSCTLGTDGPAGYTQATWRMWMFLGWSRLQWPSRLNKGQAPVLAKGRHTSASRYRGSSLRRCSASSTAAQAGSEGGAG